MKAYNDLSHISFETFLKAYEAGYERVHAAIQGLSEEELKLKIIPGKWSIWEIIFHLSDAEILGASRIRQAFTQSSRELAIYNPDIWADTMAYHTASMTDLEQQLNLFNTLRKTSSRIFKLAGLSDWDKTALHPARGDISLLTILRLYADHSERHIEQILERRELLYKPAKLELYLTERMY